MPFMYHRPAAVLCGWSSKGDASPQQLEVLGGHHSVDAFKLSFEGFGQ